MRHQQCRAVLASSIAIHTVIPDWENTALGSTSTDANDYCRPSPSGGLQILSLVNLLTKLLKVLLTMLQRFNR